MKKSRFVIKKNFIKQYLGFRKWTVSDLESRLKFKKQQISQTLSGEIEPSMNFLHRLCNVTGLPVSELVDTVFEK